MLESILLDAEYLKMLQDWSTKLRPCPFCGCEVALSVSRNTESGGKLRAEISHPINECILTITDFVHWEPERLVKAWNDRYVRVYSPANMRVNSCV